MAVGEATRKRRRVLLVSDDDQFSADLKPRLPGMDVLSLTESSVWVADRAGLNVTRGIDAVLLDHQVTGRLQLRLYETLRPTDAEARVPVIFTRSRLSAATGGFDHKLDTYQPQNAGPDDTADLVSHVLGESQMPSGVAARMAAPMPAGRQKRAGRSSGPGFIQRLVLWGVASALIGFTFWPLVGSGPIREVVFGPLKALSAGSAQVATGTSGTRAPR
jgi:DNA-binding NarL/FixJ family response regulator